MLEDFVSEIDSDETSENLMMSDMSLVVDSSVGSNSLAPIFEQANEEDSELSSQFGGNLKFVVTERK